MVVALWIYGRKTVLGCEFYNVSFLSSSDPRTSQHEQCVSPSLARLSECGLDILRTSYIKGL